MAAGTRHHRRRVLRQRPGPVRVSAHARHEGIATGTDERIAQRQRQHWDAVAGGWEAWFDWTERNFQPLTDWLLAAGVCAPGRRVLDVACGVGYPALALARHLPVGSRILATDLSDAMVAATRNRAAALGLTHLGVAAMDADALDVADESFDIVTNAYGLMFCPKPSRTLAEARRVLAAGGRVLVAVWGAPSRNPFFTTIRAAAAPFLELPEPGPDDPHPFRLASPDRLRASAVEAGFATIAVDEVAMTFECESADRYASLFADVVWKARVGRLSPADAARFSAAVRAAVAPFTIEGGRVRLGTSTLVLSARR